MTFKGVVTQVRTQKATTQKGQAVTYRDVFLAELEANPMKRLQSEVCIRPNDDEALRFDFSEGKEFDIFVLQVLEVRNGVPVVRARVEAGKLPK